MGLCRACRGRSGFFAPRALQTVWPMTSVFLVQVMVACFGSDRETVWQSFLPRASRLRTWLRFRGGSSLSTTQLATRTEQSNTSHARAPANSLASQIGAVGRLSSWRSALRGLIRPNAKISGGRRFEPREPNMRFRPLDLDVSQAYRFQFLVSKVIKKESVTRLRTMKSASD